MSRFLTKRHDIFTDYIIDLVKNDLVIPSGDLHQLVLDVRNDASLLENKYISKAYDKAVKFFDERIVGFIHEEYGFTQKVPNPFHDTDRILADMYGVG